jgi:hypothetical protein
MAALILESGGGAMGKDRVRYYHTAGGNAFWKPGKFAKAYGLPGSRPLGPDGPEARKRAIEWTAKLDAARESKRKPPPSKYPPGTLGSFWETLPDRDAFQIMEARTWEDYPRAWPAIEPRFALVRVDKISPEDSERFHRDIHPAHENRLRDPEGKLKLSWNEAHRVLKVWRALLSALVAYQILKAAPIGRVSNPAPKGREAVWLHDELTGLAECAAFAGYVGMAVAIRIAWDAMLSPVDVRLLPLSGWRGDEAATQRKKTSKRVLHAITPETQAIVEAYINDLRRRGVELLPDAPLIRRPDGTAYRTKRLFAGDFRVVRDFIRPGETRQFQDIRRSAATEARLGDATKDDIGAAMANTVAENEALAETYMRAASRRVLEARTIGRPRMAARFRNP